MHVFVFCWTEYYSSVLEKKASFTLFVGIASQVFQVCYKQVENVVAVLK